MQRARGYKLPFVTKESGYRLLRYVPTITKGIDVLKKMRCPYTPCTTEYVHLRYSNLLAQHPAMCSNRTLAAEAPCGRKAESATRVGESTWSMPLRHCIACGSKRFQELVLSGSSQKQKRSRAGAVVRQAARHR